MDRFKNKILRFIRENELIARGDSITVGFSGGADSVCLFTVLHELKALLGIRVQAVHVNHNLRGAEAERDEEFCRRLAAELGEPFCAVSVDVTGYAAEHGLTEEEAGRILRYEALKEKAEHFAVAGRALIAVAHHADDQAETVLLNLMRGSGLKGLGGMRAKRGNIIRPMLGVSRSDIVAYLKERGISYVDDSTNFENEHTRNRLRNIILPELKEYVNAAAAEHISGTAAMLRDADDYIAEEARQYVSELGEPKFAPYKSIQDKLSGKQLHQHSAKAADTETDTYKTADADVEGTASEALATPAGTAGMKILALNQSVLKQKARIFRRYVIIETLKSLNVPLKDWGERHFADIDKALFANKGYHVDLPCGVTLENKYKETCINVPSDVTERSR